MSLTDGKSVSFQQLPRRRGKTIDFRQLNRDISWREKIAQKQKKLSGHLFDSRDDLLACPVCESAKYQLFVTISGYPYVECEGCGHIFLQTPPSTEAVTSLYNGDDEQHSPQRQIYIDDDIFNQRVERIAGPKIEHCSRIIPAGGLWIDIGCGTGELLVAAARNGWQARGVEIDHEEVEFAKKNGLDVIESDIGSLDPKHLEDTKVLSLVNVLEHVKNPAEVLKKLVDAVPAGTYVVIEVPRHPSLSSFVNLAFPHLAYRHIYAPCHLHIFTEKSMEVMLNNAGLKAVALWEFGQDFQDLIYTAAANARLKEDEFLNKVVNLSANIQQVIDDMDFSDVLFIIALKE